MLRWFKLPGRAFNITDGQRQTDVLQANWVKHKGQPLGPSQIKELEGSPGMPLLSPWKPFESHLALLVVFPPSAGQSGSPGEQDCVYTAQGDWLVGYENQQEQSWRPEANPGCAVLKLFAADAIQCKDQGNMTICPILGLHSFVKALCHCVRENREDGKNVGILAQAERWRRVTLFFLVF